MTKNRRKRPFGCNWLAVTSFSPSCRLNSNFSNFNDFFQVLDSLHIFLEDLRAFQDVSESAVPARPHAHLLSAANQLVLAVTALN